VIRDVKAEDAPVLVERLLRSYLDRRANPDETFLDFARRQDVAALKTMAETIA
jgi:ferredoxin-nitrite reductase